MENKDTTPPRPASRARLKERAAAIRERIYADLDQHERITPGIHRQDSELTILLMRVHNLLLSNLWVEARQHGLTTAKHSTLLILLRSPGHMLSMSELSNELYVSRTNVTKLIDGLERQGLVERKNHPADRRSTLISLTDRARSFLERTLQRHWDYLHFLYQDLSPAEKKALLGGLYDLLASWQLGVETPTAGCRRGGTTATGVTPRPTRGAQSRRNEPVSPPPGSSHPRSEEPRPAG